MTQEDIGKYGIELMVQRYGGKGHKMLVRLRHAKYMNIGTCSNVIQLENLPPTERTTHCQVLRVHLQVAQWKHLSLTCLDPKEWGWKQKIGVMEPVKTDIEPAPAWLLQVIRCNCKTDSRHPSGTRLCACRNNGLSCVAACGGCHGEGCENSIEDERGIEQSEYENERNIF